MCVVIRTHLDTRFFPVGGEKGSHAPARWRRRRSMHRHACHSTSTPPDTACVGTFPGCALPVMSMRIGTTAAAVLCGSLYLYMWYVSCVRVERCSYTKYVRVFRLYSYSSSIYVLTFTPPSGVLAKKKNLRGKTMASIPDDRCNRVVLVYE